MFKTVCLRQFLVGVTCLGLTGLGLTGLGLTGLGLATMSLPAWSAAVASEKPTILVFGDSLSAAYGIAQQQGWVALLQEKLNSQNYGYDVINASVSGETTSGGLSRLGQALAAKQPAIVILELGANDGLRGLPVKAMKTNLEQMIKLSKAAGAEVLIIGMQIPPNYGPQYAKSFRQTYAQLSKKHKTALVAFMLEDIAAKPDLIQPDGLHPNAQAQPIVLQNIWPQLQAMLQK
jgi:acyl-CoA thioesterase-1